MKKHLVSAFLVLSIASFAQAATSYKLDTTHMQVGFKVAHLVIAKVNGKFRTFEGSFKFDEKKNKLSDLAVKIDIDSIDTNEADRDVHLKSNDFFGIRAGKGKGQLNEKKRYMTFKASGGTIKKGQSKLKGQLTIGKITKPVTLTLDYKGQVSDPWGNQKVVFEAKAKINRKDFGLKWSKKLDNGGLVVGEEVEIIIEGEANAQKTKA